MTIDKRVLIQSADSIVGFTNVDETTEPHFFIHFVDAANELESVKECKRQMLALLDIHAGQHILDLGCGTGDDAREIAGRVGKAGRVVGVDNGEIMIAEARRRTRGGELPVEFHMGDAQHLAFADGMFDACRTERLLMHLPNPQQTITEMARVTKSGGRIVIFDFDWDAVIIDHPNRLLTRHIVRLMSNSLRNGQIGRRLPALFRHTGLVDITIVPYTITPHYAFFTQIYSGVLKQAQRTSLPFDEVEEWWDDLATANDAGEFFAALPGFIVMGRKT